jgi:hypothetical protein
MSAYTSTPAASSYGFQFTQSTVVIEVMFGGLAAVSSYSSYWYGQYSSRTSHRYDSNSRVSGVDTVIAFSFQDFPVPAGGTHVIQFMIGSHVVGPDGVDGILHGRGYHSLVVLLWQLGAKVQFWDIWR